MKPVIKYYILEKEDIKFIKKKMIDLDLTYRKMSKNLNISPAYLHDIVNGKRHITPRIKAQLENQGIILKGE